MNSVYSSFEGKLHPLDLVVFKSDDPVSQLIMALEKHTTGNGDWSHVGLLITKDLLPEIDYLEYGKYYIWESTMSGNLPTGTDGIMDVETGKGFFGVQIRDFEKVVHAYTKNCGTVAISPLLNNPWLQEENRDSIRRKFKRIHEKYCRVSFDTNILSLCGAVSPIFRPARNVVESMIYRVNYRENLDIEIEELSLPSREMKQKHLNKIRSKGKKSIVFDLWSERPRSTPIPFELRAPTKRNFLDSEQDSHVAEKLFCSEMVATFYVLIGVIDRSFDPRDVLPTDFFSGTDVDGLPIICGTPEIIFPN